MLNIKNCCVLTMGYFGLFCKNKVFIDLDLLNSPNRFLCYFPKTVCLIT